AISIAWVIRFSWEHPRPFVIGIGHTLMHHAASSSFPSFHVTVMFAIAFGLWLLTLFRRVAWVIFGLTLLVAWARIYVGVHYPIDMAGAVIVAGVSTCSVFFAVSWWRRMYRRRGNA